MNEIVKLIDSFWNDDDSFDVVYARLKNEVSQLQPAIAGIIGKELLLRKKVLSTSEFAVAAFLASGGEAGNDSLMDFIDCVAILPDSRYKKILEDHDSLIDDPVGKEFGEFGFYNLFESRFESVFRENGDGLLFLLVRGQDKDESMMENPVSSCEPAQLFPRLFQRYGKFLAHSSTESVVDNKVTLDDFFGNNRK